MTDVVDLNHLSFSALTTFQDCGERYRLTRVVKVPETSGWARVGGSAFHTASENLDKADFGVPTDGPIDFDAAFDLEIQKSEERYGPRAEWKASGRASKAWPEKEGERWWRENGPLMLQRYRTWQRNAPLDIWIDPHGNPAIEIKVSFTLGTTPVEGYIDRVYQTRDTKPRLILVDLKTGREPKGIDQLGIYRLGLRATLGVDVNLGSYYMAKEALSTPPADLTVFDNGRLEYEFSQAFRLIKAGEFIPNRGMLCDHCGVRRYCSKVDGEESKKYLPWAS